MGAYAIVLLRGVLGGPAAVRGTGRMSADAPSCTVADVLHHMYAASADPYRFPGTLAALLGMGVDGLRALYDQPAPDPDDPHFAERVGAIAGQVGCDPAVLAALLREWAPAGEERTA